MAGVCVGVVEQEEKRNENEVFLDVFTAASDFLGFVSTVNMLPGVIKYYCNPTLCRQMRSLNFSWHCCVIHLSKRGFLSVGWLHWQQSIDIVTERD